MNPFIGTWHGDDPYLSEVEYTVIESNTGISVSAIDPTDGESAEVSEVSLAQSQLCFTAFWASTGRVSRCSLQICGENEAYLTFTYTDHARLVRKLA